ncbi:exonuclease domain-containing protein [Nocardia farcinica]|nr:exonuclease domain-containing protein [Nocardia farcinica]
MSRTVSMLPDHRLGACALVDLETSGLAPTVHRALSVTVITVEDTGVVSGEFHTLLDPGCDPGPVHIHGLTPERLSGAPKFEDVQQTLESLLRDRLLIAHNAGFDYGFLDQEFRRCGGKLPVSRRMCTLALARRVAPPTPDRRLASLAAHYGVVQRRSHDSLDDTRVLVGVLHGLLGDARRMGIDPPVLPCSPARATTVRYDRARVGPKPPCPYVNPGRFEPGKPLVQGMQVAITGSTRRTRAELVACGDEAGLNMVGSVSRRTSLLVTNQPLGSSAKARRATEHGTPTIDEEEFVRLLSAVQPGDTAAPVTRARSAPRRTPPTAPGPLAGRRILVVGGAHEEAALARTRIGELGGSAAVNLSATVTDILALANATSDRRFPRILELGLPIHGPELFTANGTASVGRLDDPQNLVRGQVIDLPIETSGHEWTFQFSWSQSVTREVDLVAFVLGESDRVSADEDFVFYNQPQNECVLLTTDGPNEQLITLRLDAVPGHCRRIVLAAALDEAEATFADLGPIEVEAAPGPDAAPIARTTLDAATTERTLLLLEVYLRGEAWRLRSVGQGYDTGLAALATRFGVDVEN